MLRGAHLLHRHARLREDLQVQRVQRSERQDQVALDLRYKGCMRGTGKVFRSDHSYNKPRSAGPPAEL